MMAGVIQTYVMKLQQINEGGISIGRDAANRVIYLFKLTKNLIKTQQIPKCGECDQRLEDGDKFVLILDKYVMGRYRNTPYHTNCVPEKWLTQTPAIINHQYIDPTVNSGRGGAAGNGGLGGRVIRGTNTFGG